MDCSAVSIGDWRPTFREKINLPRNVGHQSVSDTLPHPEERRLQLYCCGSLRCHADRDIGLVWATSSEFHKSKHSFYGHVTTYSTKSATVRRFHGHRNKLRDVKQTSRSLRAVNVVHEWWRLLCYCQCRTLNWVIASTLATVYLPWQLWCHVPSLVICNVRYRIHCPFLRS